MQSRPATAHDVSNAEELAPAIAAKLASAGLWDIVDVLMKEPGYSDLKLSDLSWLAVPSFKNRHYLVVQITSPGKATMWPVAVVLWARVSDDVDAALRSRPEQLAQLDDEARRSGPHIWITAAAGDAASLEAAMKTLKEGEFKGEPLNFIHMAADGPWSVTSMPAV